MDLNLSQPGKLFTAPLSHYSFACKKYLLLLIAVAFTMSVFGQAAISVQPSTSAQMLCTGGAGTALSVTASGTGLTYTWYSNSVNSNSGGTPVSLAIGQSYLAAGGIVGYILAPGDPGYKAGQIAGLIVSPNDIGNGIEWGCQGTSIATSTAFGSGLANTNAIIASCPTLLTGARVCHDLTLNGFSDWYLPSLNEMNKFYINQDAIGGFANTGYYWSSSQCDATNALGFGFKNGDIGSGCGTKHDGDRIRATRSFAITNSFTPSASSAGTTYYYVVVTSTDGSSVTSDVSGPVTVSANLTPSVSIATDTTTIAAGASATFTATPVNGGDTPAYQWQKNGSNVGTNSATYVDSALTNNDAITCFLTSNATCATPGSVQGNTITMTVLSPAISTTGSLSALSTTYGAASSATTFNVSGANMSEGILISPPAGFEVSASPDSGFGSTVTIGAAGTIPSTAVYIRLAAASAAGSYSGDVVLSSHGAADVPLATVSSDVNRADLTITADNQTKVYGDGLPELTATYNGFVNGDTPASLSALPTLTPTADASSHVAGNPYAIIPHGAAADNYNISYINGSLLVTPAPLTISADSQSKVYGDALPELTASYTGFVNGDTQASLTVSPTVNTSATAASHVSGNPYAITASGAIDGDYTISYTSGSMTITAAPLTITADNLAMTYGGPLPDLTVQYSGFVNGDTFLSLASQPAISTTATNSSLPGSYPIHATGAADADYSISYIDGSMTVNASSDATLSDIVLNSGPLTPAGPDNYTASVPFSTTSVKIKATASSPAATIQVNGTPAASGSLVTISNLVVGPNIITTTITAQDGTINTYTITLTRAASPNANLSNLKVSTGTLSPAFNYTVTAYTMSVAYATTSIKITPATSDAAATITVNSAAVSSGTASGAITLNVGDNIITTTVTAADGVSTKSYVITVTRAASPNANLSNLKISTGTMSPAFNYLVTAYTTSVAYATTSIKITPAVSDPGATVTVNSAAVTSGTASGAIALNVGDNIIITTVTAADGVSTKSYTVTVTRAASPNTNLSNLKISTGTMSPAFNYTVTAYTTSVAYATTSIKVTPTASDAGATITVNSTAVNSGTASAAIALSVGDNIITTTVTAADGVSTKNYTITVTRAASPNANLSNLKISTGTLLPAFNYTVTTYTASVTNATASMKITPAASDPGATITVNSATVSSGTASGAITLNVGDNVITTTVTAADGVSTKSYAITVTRAAPGGLNSLYQPIAVERPANTPGITGADENIVVQQGLSPNGDGLNDRLIIDGITTYPDNKLMIVNRNGQLIFEAKGYDNSQRVFDGHSSKTGAKQLPGTYFYSLDYNVKGVAKHKTGFIILKY